MFYIFVGTQLSMTLICLQFGISDVVISRKLREMPNSTSSQSAGTVSALQKLRAATVRLFIVAVFWFPFGGYMFYYLGSRMNEPYYIDGPNNVPFTLFLRCLLGCSSMHFVTAEAQL